MSRRTPALLAAVATLTLVLAGCVPEGAPTSSSAPPASPSASSSAPSSPSPSAPAQATIPASCDDVGTAATRASTVDQLNLQGDGTGFVRPAPAGAALALGCDWIVGDATGFLLLISEVDPAAAADYVVQSLPGDGYTCNAEADDTWVCTMTTANTQFPADTVETIVSRGDVWIYTSATNIDGTQLITELQQQIWSS